MFAELFSPLRRSSPERQSFNLNDPAAWDAIFGGVASDSGVKVTERKALGLGAVWQCVDMISADVAKLPLNRYVRTGESDEDREVDGGHATQAIVRRRANTENSAFRFWRRLMVHALLWNNGYAFIDRDRAGRPLQLINLLPDRTCPERIGGRMFYVTETTRQDGSPWLRPIPAEDVIHIQGLSIESEKGCDLVEAAKNSFGLALGLQKFKSRFFKNGVRTGGILELPAAMKPTTRDKVEEGFRKSYEGEDNWFKTVILRDGAKFHQTTVTPADSETSEATDAEVREVGRYFRVAPSKLGLSDSVSYNSKAEDNQAYLDTTLSPWLVEICSECDLKLLDPGELESGAAYFEHNTKSLLKMNLLQRSQVYAIWIRNKIATPNECRRFENMPPIEGGDNFPQANAPAIVAGSSDGGADKDGNSPPRGPGKEPGEES